MVHGGSGVPVLLLHGYPQSHVMWHKIAPGLAERHTVVAPDMRGYGDSAKPAAAPGDHQVYCKRTTAEDIVDLMNGLGHDAWHVVGHDRGARVAHRMALDHGGKLLSFTSLDVVATQAAFDGMDSAMAFAWFHWLLMRQPHPSAGNADRQLASRSISISCWNGGALAKAPSRPTPMRNMSAVSAIKRQSTRLVRNTAPSSLTLSMTSRTADTRSPVPCLCLWGTNTAKRPGWQTGKSLGVIDTWKERVEDVRGRGLECGHFLPEEKPDEVLAELLAFYDEIAQPETRDSAMTAKKFTTHDMQACKDEGRKFTMLSIYDYPTALLAERAGLDTILVGDSLAMTVLGHDDTVSVTMQEMLHHVKAVARAAASPMVVADMPFLSYQVSERDAILNAGRFMKEGRADAVKLEGGADRRSPPSPPFTAPVSR